MRISGTVCMAGWIVLASAEGKSPSLAWEKELAHSPGHWTDGGRARHSCCRADRALMPGAPFLLTLKKVCGPDTEDRDA